jgi:hypothetical protein
MKGYYSTWQDATPLSGHYCPSTRMAEYRSLDFNGHLASQHAVNDWPNVLLEMTKLSTMWRPIKYKEVLEPEKVDRTRPVYADRSLHSVRSLSLFHARLSCWCHHTSFMTGLSLRASGLTAYVASGHASASPACCSARPTLTGCTGALEASVRSLLVTFYVSVSSLTTLCITLCTYVSIFS